MMKIKQIWEELKNDRSFNKGLLIRRYSGTILPDVFIALQQPENLLCIASSISSNIEINIASFANLQEIEVNILPDIHQQGRNILLFKLTNSQHDDIFAVLCEDLISSISTETDERKLVSTLLNRFEKWKSLFNKFTLNGLSSEEQTGLFGELFFLRKSLQYKNDFENVLNTWVGPTNEIRDFQFGNWALEVKTSLGNNHQKIHISSERQLDTTHIEKLYLYHLSLEKRQEGGESLPQIIESMQTILKPHASSTNRFKTKLLETGYFEQHADLYSHVGYHVRQENFYKVEGEFPRLQENEIRNGMGDVKYSIVISQCHQYIQPELQIFENISVL